MPQITITYNCRSGRFHFHPDPLPVPYNANSTITWKVVGKHVPSGGSVTFPATSGVVFGSNWPGTTPVIDPNDATQYTAQDNNNSSNTAGDFKYTTTLAVTDGQGQTTNPSYDPDVENEGPPATISRRA
jgi:hypothetical protein